jgi:mRNA-degrading endonuclease RelE of RelBE toxin-antitoxin system
MMFDEDTMRTTLAIDDDVLRAAKELARSERKTLGEKISELARQALRPAPGRRRTRNGVPLLPVRRGGTRVTSALVQALREELP